MQQRRGTHKIDSPLAIQRGRRLFFFNFKFRLLAYFRDLLDRFMANHGVVFTDEF